MQPEPGVPQSRALDRARRISNTRYDLRLRLPDSLDTPVTGESVITFELNDASTPLVVDFAPAGDAGLAHIRVNGRDARADTAHPAAVHHPGAPHIVLEPAVLERGTNTVAIAFTAGDAPLNRRDNLLYSIFVPARAHEVLPCFDQPDIKARWTLTLDAPARWQVVSNAAAEHVEPATDASGAPRLVTRFAETRPLPTYLFAFAAGAFHVEEATRGGRLMRVFHSDADADRLAANLAPILDAHAGALDWLEHYTDIAYPFDTFDIVLVPAFQFSGMEHPGAIFYNAATLLLAPSATRQQALARAHVIAHETAHLWFGDLVTMRWFDDVWMKEVCANFMAAKIVNPQFADLDHDLRFLQTHYPGAYDVDRTAGTHPIRQSLANLAEAGSLYGAIIYLKSPIVFRQLELRMGEEALRDALRTFLRTYAFGNASWPDLIDILASSSGPEIREWSRAWIDEPGRPTLHVDLVMDGPLVSQATVHADADARGQRLELAVGRGATVERVSVWCAGAVELAPLPGRVAPDYVLANGRGLGYGRFVLDDRSLAYLLAHLPALPDALTRASAWLTLWDAMLEGDAAPDVLLTTALKALDAEDSELNLQRLLSCLERLFWIFTASRDEADTCEALEAQLFAMLARHDRTSVKAAVFGTLRSVATRPGTTAWLEAVLMGNRVIPGLPLGDADRAAIALDLAVRTTRSDDRLAQVARTLTDDERRGFLAFAAPAVSPDAVVRRHFVEGLSDPARRRREPWVVEALRWLHHPLHEQRSLHYLRPGLDLLDDVARTGDIFLPKRWLDAMFSGHRSVAAARVVEAFLANPPAGFPEARRRMVLASADPLFRAAALMTSEF